MEYEREGYEEVNSMDEIFVLDGKGKMLKLEVADDVSDN